ncbi:MAG: polysaccharide biosynthesis protein, partial [Leeuwenhoekiella sp.]
MKNPENKKSSLYNTLITKVQEHPQFSSLLQWGKLVSVTGLTEIIVQAVGFIAGIFIIRLLPVEEYALYTLSNTMLGTMTVLANGGIATGVLSQGGKIWKDKKQLGTVLATGLMLRRKFAIGSLIVSIPILGYLLYHHNASWLMIILITVSL